MKLLVTGATGFIGQNVVPMLLARNHEIHVISRSDKKLSYFPWSKNVQPIICDINEPKINFPRSSGRYDAVMHLAWQEVSDCNSLFHLENNLPINYRFLKSMAEMDIGQLLVAGTCYEYGMQSGCLSEYLPTFPANPYALAKDTLRKFLESLQNLRPFTLQWARIFYMYGHGQHPNSLLARLDRAIDEGEPVFNMSGGEQLRDYLPVKEVARRLVALIEHPEVQNIVNCCSGNPVSVRRLVENRIAERNADIEINFGYFPYRDYEPMAFWGNSEKFNRLLES